MQAVDVSPVAPSAQTQRPGDLFLIFLGANIVATTLQVGASLAGVLPLGWALPVIAVGSLGGAALVASLAPIGSRLGVPSIVATRAVLGFSGARLLAFILFVTNFAWIALNDVIAASIAVRLTGIGTTATWATALGVLAALVVSSGPRGVALADRLAVPLLVASGVVFTVACLRTPWPQTAVTADAPTAASALRALDVVTGYQVSWLLMFADYPRYVASARKAAVAVFGGLALAALWFMPLGVIASAIAGSADPGTMVDAVGVGWWGAMLLTLATLTTNFVNIYMSALAFKTLRPGTSDRATVWLIGGIGAALGLLSTAWLEQFGNLMLLLAGAFVPIGGILLAHYVLLREPVDVAALYSARPARRHGHWSPAGAAAWCAGAITYALADPIGATLPSLAVTVAVYAVGLRWGRRAR